MHFDLTEDQRQFEDGVDRLLTSAADLTILAKGAEEFAKLRQRLDAELTELGATGILVPEEFGGLGMGLLTLTVLAARLGHHVAPTSVVDTALAAWLVAQAGDDELRARWLQGLLEGRFKAAFALHDVTGNWAPSSWQSPGSDGQVRKRTVSDAESADLIIAGVGGELVAIEKNAVVVSVPGQAPMDLSRPFADISFAMSAATPFVPGYAQKAFDALLVLTAADAAAAGKRALEMSVDYAKTREQFGRPIGSFQGIKHQLANMAADIEPAGFLAWYAAHAWDKIPSDSSRSAALAKAHCTDVAVKTIRAAVEVHGGIGYTWEYPLHLLLKRAMYDRMVLGSPAILRNRVAELTPSIAAAA